MRSLLCIAVLAGCGSQTPETATPVANVQPSSRLVDPVLDYRRPMLPPPPSNKETGLYTSKCLRGDREACLRVNMRTLGTELLPQIEANCRAGHDLSCRGVVAAKHFVSSDYPLKLEASELRRGCMGGLWVECDLLIESSIPADVRFGAEIMCLYTQRVCAIASGKYQAYEPVNLDRARYLLELGCQGGDVMDCYRLAYLYLDGELEEPVAGRGRDLARYACGRQPNDPCPWDLETMKLRTTD